MKIVYYPEPVPNDRYTITVLSLLFDEIVLPALYLPSKGYTDKELEERIAGIKKLIAQGNHGYEDHVMLLAMHFAHDYGKLLDIFSGTGKLDEVMPIEPEASELAKELEAAYYGPPAPGFTPMISEGVHFGINDDVGSTFRVPSKFTYPANAYLYSLKNNLPLISDSSIHPVPSTPHNSNADTFAAHLAIQTLGTLALPKIRPLTQDEILKARSKLKDDLSNFNNKMYEYVDDLRKIVNESTSATELQREAKYIADTKIRKDFLDLIKKIESPGAVLSTEIRNFTLDNAELIIDLSYKAALQDWLSVIKMSASAAGKFTNGLIKSYQTNKKLRQNSGLNLLLKLPEQYRK